MTDKDSEKEASKIFSVPDFVGDACKAIASRVRGAVAGVQFDDFHKVCVCTCMHGERRGREGEGGGGRGREGEEGEEGEDYTLLHVR